MFPKILKGELPASFVHRDEWVSAFMDVQPVTPGHVLVVPNKAASTLAELDPEYGARMFQVAQAVAASLRESQLSTEGINLFLADGVAAGQTVFYPHLHVIPRYHGDGFGIQFPPDYNERPPREELEKNAELISVGLHL
ncbi:MAG: HIT family protein [Gammaproteobacteria bacterium]